jgi:enamine deaminase RidA (YjgF/YER057c/UK114 family)
MTIERINPPTLYRSTSRSEVVRAGDTVYLSSQGPMDREGRVVGVADADAQAAHIFQSFETALAAVGGTMHDLVKITAFLTRPEYFAAIAKARELFLPVRGDMRPAASTTVVIPMHARPNVLLEVEAIAVVGDTASSHERIDPPRIARTPGHPQAAKAGNVLHVTGIMARRWGQIIGKADAEIQARMVFDQLDYLLECAGATRADVVRHMTYYTHPFHYDTIRKVQEDYFGGRPPATTAVYVHALGSGPDPLVEIEATGVIGGEKRHLNPPGLARPRAGTCVVEADGTAYLAGQVALNAAGELVGKGDVDAQLAQIYANFDETLRAIGATRANVVKTTTYMTRPDYFASVRQAREAYYGGAPPTSTAFVVQGLTDPDYLVEIEAVAVLD